jgi:hypothetical protein
MSDVRVLCFPGYTAAGSGKPCLILSLGRFGEDGKRLLPTRSRTRCPEIIIQQRSPVCNNPTSIAVMDDIQGRAYQALLAIERRRWSDLQRPFWGEA